MIIKNIFLFILLGLGLLIYFLPGDILGLDAHSHIGRSWIFREIILTEHSFPIWSNTWYFGFPIGLYYGFLYYLTNAFLSVITFGDILLSSKLLLWLLHIGSGIAIYHFMKLLTRSVPSALFSAAFYVFSYHHIATIVRGGRHPLSIVFFLLPLLFYFYEKFCRGQSSLLITGTLSSIILSFILFTHLQYGVYAAIAFYCFVTIRTTFCADRKAQLSFILLSGCLYLCFSAWFLVPAIVESKYLMLSSVNSKSIYSHFSEGGLSKVLRLFIRENGNAGSSIYYCGIVPLAMTFFSIFQKDRNPTYKSFLMMFLLGFLIVLLSARFVNIWLLFAAILTGYGVSVLKNRYVLLFITILLMIDLAPFIARKPYRNLNNSMIESLQAKINEKGECGHILVLTKSRSTLWRSLDCVNTNATTPFGGIPQTSTKTHPYVAAIASKASMEIFDEGRELSRETVDLFRFLNIKYIWIPAKKKVLSIPYTYPVWFSQSPLMYEGQTPLNDQTWSSIRTNFEKRNFDYSYIKNLIDYLSLDHEKPLIGKNLKLSSEFTILNINQSNHRFDLHFLSSEDGYISLPYSYYPFNTVKIDGIKTASYPSMMNFTTIPISKGDHVLSIEASISTLRKVLICVALIVLCLDIVVIFYYSINKR